MAELEGYVKLLELVAEDMERCCMSCMETGDGAVALGSVRQMNEDSLACLWLLIARIREISRRGQDSGGARA